MNYFLNSVKLFAVVICLPLLFAGCVEDKTPPTIQEASISVVSYTNGKHLKVHIKAKESEFGEGIYEWRWKCHKADHASSNASNPNGDETLSTGTVSVASSPRKYQLDEDKYVTLAGLGFPVAPGFYEFEITVVDYAGNEMWRDGQFFIINL